MKKVKLFLAIIIAVTTLSQSCMKDKDGNPVTSKLERVKWTYNYKDSHTLPLPSPMPAIDEDGNYYISTSETPKHFLKLNTVGEVLWDKTYYSMVPRYIDHKLFGIVGTGLVRVDPADGNEIWRVEGVDSLGVFMGNIAITSDRIYTIRTLGSLVNYLQSYDHDGNLKSSIKLIADNIVDKMGTSAMSVRDNQIYIASVLFTSSDQFVIMNYEDNNDTFTQNWFWTPDNGFDPVSSFFSDIAIDDANNLLFGLEDKHNHKFIYSVNSEGTENWHQLTSMKKGISNVTVDKDGMCYVAFDKCEKIGPEGVIWTSTPKKDWEYSGLISKGVNIDIDGNIVFETFSTLLTSLSPSGKPLWEQYDAQCADYCEGEYYKSLIAPNGDIILVSNHFVRCFAGNGHRMSEKGWPKQYGNYGNTCSK